MKSTEGKIDYHCLIAVGVKSDDLETFAVNDFSFEDREIILNSLAYHGGDKRFRDRLIVQATKAIDSVLKSARREA